MDINLKFNSIIIEHYYLLWKQTITIYLNSKKKLKTMLRKYKNILSILIEGAK